MHKPVSRLASCALAALGLMLPSPLAAPFAAPLAAAPGLSEARYVVNIAGTIIASVDITLSKRQTAYSIGVDASITGLGQLVTRGSATIEITGIANGSAYAGEDFKLETNSSEGSSSVDVRLSRGRVEAFYVAPPLPPHFDRVPVERRQLVNVNDMVSAFIIKASALDASVCNRRLRIFTGIELFDLKMRFVAEETATSVRTGYQGPVVLCQMQYLPISGHYSTSEVTSYLQASDRLLIWYAPLGDADTFIPYRVLIGTSLGDLSMVLTRLR